MKTINLNLNSDKKYVIACSYGPDSMALLDAAIKDNLNIVVAHVNYHKREVSNKEQFDLTEYCHRRNIPIYILDLKDEKSIGNFQEWAREKRYLFFSEVLKKTKADCVLVAHQEDDVIETYLMQKKRGNFVKYYGISRENELFGTKILRPLLNYSKQSLLEYDLENNVPFSIDQSNLSDHYTRNVFRHHVVEKMNSDERQKILQEVKNTKETKPSFKKVYTKDEFINMNYSQIIELFDFYMTKTKEHRDISKAFVEEIKKAIGHKSNYFLNITENVIFEEDYDEIRFINAKKLHSYCFQIKETYRNEFLNIDFSKGLGDRKITKEYSRIYIKNCNKEDKVIINNYLCSVRRLFIDWKMPQYLRKIWPGIYNEKGELIYIPRYRKNYIDKHESLLEINTEYFCEF